MNRRRVRLAAASVLPAAGILTLAWSLVLTGPMPVRADLDRLQELTLEQTRIRHELMLQAPAPQDALAERLPRTLTVGALLRRLERAARQAGVRAVSFGTEEDAPAGQEKAAPQPVDEPTAHDAVGPQPESLRCQITLEAEYRALVMFLGLVESMPAATRVRSLTITPLAEGVTATVGLEGFAYAGDGREIDARASPAADALPLEAPKPEAPKPEAPR